MKWAQYHLRAQYGIVNAFHEGTNLTLTATFLAKVFFLLYNKETKANKGLSHLPKGTQEVLGVKVSQRSSQLGLPHQDTLIPYLLGTKCRDPVS